jgi:dihydrofolate synthase / folylpolyglutamate synthase
VNYSDAIEFLYGLRRFGFKLGLETTRHLTHNLGHPERSLRFIHVAGTNGKGSTCAVLESLYRAAGYRVGLFTSPHLVRFSERIQVNRESIPDADVVRLVARLRQLLDGLPSDRHPTFFEVVTVIALLYFAEQHCDLVVWETGMGGRLDATNIVTPLASVITNVQFDHQTWLGSTHAQIAAEKAGIIKPNVPVLTATDEVDALDVLARTAQSLHAPLTVVTHAHVEAARDSLRHLSLLGEHQKQNATLALATLQTLNPILPVAESRIHTALRQVHWPGRLQLVHLPDQRQLLLDGAHNLAGAESLQRAFQQLFPAVQPTLILGILHDKDWAHMAHRLAPLARRILCVPVRSERTAPLLDLARTCQAANPAATVEQHAALESAFRSSTTDPFVLVAGSLYLVGETMELLRLAPGTGSQEAGLNDYSTQP